MRLILISGFSGSGKSVALRALEDSGFYCVDNLPATMLYEAMALYADYGYDQIAISMDTRSRSSLGALPMAMTKLRAQSVTVSLLFLEATSSTLVKRCSKSSRRHLLSSENVKIEESIALEHEMLSEIMGLGTRIDTSDLSANELRSWVRELIAVDSNRLTIILESFGFKHGLPRNADFVFDVRCLPNPYYDRQLRALSGRDKPIVDFFKQAPDVQRMVVDIHYLVSKWLPRFSSESRGYLTIAIGCTGGQHRSVYITEQLAQLFAAESVLVRHRQLYCQN